MKPIINNPIEIKFLKATSYLSYKEQIELFKDIFGIELTKRQIGNFRKRFDLQPKRILLTEDLTPEQINYIKKNIKGNTLEDITKKFFRKFRIRITKEQVRSIKRNNKINSGVDMTFKKGQKAHNHKPIGSEFITDYDYVKIKTAEPNTWEYKHRVIYEQYYGKIPKGYSVIFLDQNKRNFDINNLKLVKDEERNLMANRKLFFNNKNLTETGLLIAKVDLKEKEIRKGKHND